MTFAEKLKLIRKEKSITQEEFAEKLSVSRQAVSKWESGNGYPETEKLLLISKLFDVSLDYLLLDDNMIEKKKAQQPPERVYVSGGKIAIASFDKQSLVDCISVKSSQLLSAGKNQPKYILNGIDRITFWGEHSTILGWYITMEDVQQEIEEINSAISRGEASYELKYAADVEYVGFFQQPKLK